MTPEELKHDEEYRRLLARVMIGTAVAVLAFIAVFDPPSAAFLGAITLVVGLGVYVATRGKK